jgi:hypothetical protein
MWRVRNMSYENYTDPGGGYSPYNSGGKGYSNSAVPGYLTTSTPKKAEPDDFTSLSTIRDGVGDYHMNHFIAYFEPYVDKFKPVNSIKFFYQEFCNIFSSNNVAKVSLDRTRKFQELDVVKFTIGGNLGNFWQQLIGEPHDDWVAMQMAGDGQSFYGTTLKRMWLEPIDAILLAGINAGLPLLGPLLGPIVVEANMRHFLAGRRSWRVGLNRSLNLYYVETAAFERSSHDFYQGAELTGLLRESIRDLWTYLLENYPVKLCPIEAMQLVPKDYLVKGNVAYRMDADPSAQTALLRPWFSDVLKRHPGLVADL